MFWKELMSPQNWEFWATLALVLATLELIDGTFILLSLGLGCLFPMVAASLGLDSTVGLVGICILGQLSVFFAIRPFFRKWADPGDLPTNADALIGRFGLVTEDISRHTPGYVKIGGEEWRAVSSDDAQIDKGMEVKVIGLSGATVEVTQSAS